jgi:hypothetical protein
MRAPRTFITARDVADVRLARRDIEVKNGVLRAVAREAVDNVTELLAVRTVATRS